MLTLIHGDGAGLRPEHHSEAVLATAARIMQHIQKGHIEVAHLLASNLTPIERSVVARRLLNRGIEARIVLRTLS